MTTIPHGELRNQSSKILSASKTARPSMSRTTGKSRPRSSPRQRLRSSGCCSRDMSVRLPKVPLTFKRSRASKATQAPRRSSPTFVGIVDNIR